MAAQHDHRTAGHRGDHLLGQCPGADEHAARKDGHTTGGQARARDVERADDRPDPEPGQVGGDQGLRVGVHDRGHVRARTQQLGVQGQLVRDAPAVQLTVGRRGAVERHQPDVLGGGPGQTAFPRATAAHQQALVVDAQAHVPEKTGREGALGEHAARVRNQLTFFDKHGS